MSKNEELDLMFTVLKKQASRKSLAYRLKALLYRPGMSYWRRHLLFFRGVCGEASALVLKLRHASMSASNGDLRGILIAHLDHFERRAKIERQAFSLPEPWLARDLEALAEHPDLETDHRRLIQELEYFLESSHGMAPTTVRRQLGELVGRYRDDMDRKAKK